MRSLGAGSVAMRIGVVSDTHGEEWALAACMVAAGPVDAWFHLGDYVSDAQALQAQGKPVYSVCGNMDALATGPRERVVELGGKRFFLCHGHSYGVKSGLLRLTLRARELGCQAALFGHTHIPFLDEEGDILLLNPGSPSFPRGGSKRCMGLLMLAEDSLEGELLPLT